MGYSEEQTRAYEAMLYDFEVFEEMKKSLKKEKCHIHNNKLRIEASWENDYDINIFISKYCCVQFAESIAAIFMEAKRFNKISIVNR